MGAQRRQRGRGIAVDPQLDELATEAPQQGGRRVERDDLTRVDDRDAVAEPLRLVEVVRGQQDRHLAAGAQACDHVEQLVPDARVEADRRLVEEEHLRLREQRTRDLEPATLAAAVPVDGPVDEVGDPERVRELGDPRLRNVRLDSPQAGVDVEVATAGQRAVDDRILEDDAACPPGCERLGRDVEAREARRARRGRDRRRQHPDRGRLACTVGAEQAEDLSGGDLEVDALHRLDAAGIGLAKPLHFDCVHWFLLFGHICLTCFVTAMTEAEERM